MSLAAVTAAVVGFGSCPFVAGSALVVGLVDCANSLQSCGKRLGCVQGSQYVSGSHCSDRLDLRAALEWSAQQGIGSFLRLEVQILLSG